MKKLKPLILVRHAEAQHHVQEITGGWSDTDLTERGRRQTSLLAERLKSELSGVAIHLASSDLKRSVQTVSILGGSLGVKPEIYPQLRDLNNGVAAGKTHAEAKAIAVKPTEPIVDWHPYPQSESWRQFFNRISKFLTEYTCRQEQSPAQAALLVTHSAAIHVIIDWWLGIGIDSPTHFEISPSSLTVLTTNRWNERTIERLNDTAHLYAHGMPDKIQLF
ncbi:MAG TPA: histidine phosphatase family protein [Anaerolineales bacterium]